MVTFGKNETKLETSFDLCIWWLPLLSLLDDHVSIECIDIYYRVHLLEFLNPIGIIVFINYISYYVTTNKMYFTNVAHFLQPM